MTLDPQVAIPVAVNIGTVLASTGLLLYKLGRSNQRASDQMSSQESRLVELESDAKLTSSLIRANEKKIQEHDFKILEISSRGGEAHLRIDKFEELVLQVAKSGDGKSQQISERLARMEENLGIILRYLNIGKGGK